MTIQEKAIEQLERISRHLAAIGEKEDYTGVAIQALERECDDAISRQAVLDIVKFEENWLSDAKSNNADTDIAFSGIRTQVAKLSPVTKALEPCEDCVSRQVVLDMMQMCMSGKELYKAVYDLPPVTPTPKKDVWIPCSERLPEDFQRVLVSIVNYSGHEVVRVAKYYGFKRIFQIEGNYEHWEVGEKGLLAWMPLPEPIRQKR